ncbi:alpha/beta hydrolase [Halobacillus litoralis]|uniref:alpha/beta hydrolase n=1 Tax=Halobacillus litoralis TaxID=45668 RepID=UPI001CFE5974|nr:alpha/beta fold hydrolase [Halobacillus litoralis]
MMETNWSHYTTRDTTSLSYLPYIKNESNKEAIIVIHGITAEIKHHKKFVKACERKADIFVPILRGYAQSSRRGDIEYIGQYDHDLLDFIHYIKQKGYETISLLGHSMGCANMLRLIQQNPSIVDEYIFVAPFFHPTLPVYHEHANEQTKHGADVDYTVYGKKVFLLMFLYKMNIHRFNHRTVAEIPDELFENGRLHLSFRLLVSRFLEKIPEDLFRSMQDRILIFAGENDEVIDSNDLQFWVENKWGLHVEIIPDADHNKILHHDLFHQYLAACSGKVEQA